MTVEDRLLEPMTPLSVIVKNKYVPVLPYDWMTEDGKLKDIRPVKLPMVIGYGFAGVVKRVGILRNKNLIGKKVIGANISGAAKEYINSQIPPLLFEVPENVALKDAATVIGGADAALHAVKTTRASAHDVVLVTGASGGVGSYLIQLLKQRGALVVAIGHPNNFDFLKEVGADYVVSYKSSLALQLKKVPTINKVIDTVGEGEILRQISNATGALEILSLSMTNFSSLKTNQSFKFSHGTVGIQGYRDLLNLMAQKKNSRSYSKNISV
ncbi:zinc-binding dehydrogenase [Pediococcus acidilactici]